MRTKNKDINISETVPVVVRVRGVGPRFVREMIVILSCKVITIIPPLSVTEGVTLVKSPQMRDWGWGLCLLSKYRRIAVWGVIGTKSWKFNSISNYLYLVSESVLTPSGICTRETAFSASF